jgi:hypothetical protein
MSAEKTRRILAALAVIAPLLVVVVSWWNWRDRLPAELASHWSGMGAADGAMAAGSLFALYVGLTGVSALAGVAIALWSGISARARRGWFFLLGMFGGMGATSWLLAAALTTQTGDPYAVVLGAWSILSMASVGYGIVPFLISPRPEVEATDVPSRFEFEPSETGAWSHTITGSIFVWATLGLIILGAVLYGPALIEGRASDALFGIVTLSVAIVFIASFMRLRVTADWRGLRVVSSVFRVPLKRIRLDRIDVIEAAELRPAEWGGWGYRIMPGRSALILRKGPGLIVTMTNQKQFAITLDDPDVPAALLATLRDDNSSALRAATRGDS